jgi:hypothetical protein
MPAPLPTSVLQSTPTPVVVLASYDGFILRVKAENAEGAIFSLLWIEGGLFERASETVRLWICKVYFDYYERGYEE